LKVKHEELKERVRQLTDELKEAKRDGKNVALSSKERDKFLLQFDKLGKTYIEDTFKFVVSKMTISNYTASRDRILKSIGVCRTIGFDWADNLETEYAERIKDEYKRVLRIEEMRLEQQRVKEQIKEEQRALRELEAIKKKEEQAIKEREAAEKTRAEMQRAIAEALEKASGEHTAQILEMERILAEKNKEIELKKQEIDDSQRAIANAQITKVGNVYVLSNIGSFGQNVYKIGMTRRDNPDDRVKELGDASVPFPFDVHIMVGADNAPELEKMLHHRFNRQRVNKVNLRKEFFRVGIEDIQKEIETFLNKKVEYRADPRIMEEYAEEYRQSEHISETDIEEIEKMFDESGIETDE
jgi:hypothetical protein